MKLFSPLLCSGLFLASLHCADASDSSTFWAIKTSLGEATMDNSSHNNGIGTGALIAGEIDGQLEETTLTDYTAGVGLTLGQRFGNWQAEIDYLWRYRTDWDLVAPTPSIQTITNVFSNVETTSVMLNLARRGVLSQFWSWEAGLGIGYVRNNVEASFIERATDTLPEFELKSDTKTSDFGYNVFVGVTREVWRDWTLNVRARYIDLGDLEAGPFDGRAVNLNGEHSSLEMQFALEHDF
ncbi:MAG: outer membrane beta-barrel protein [Pseudomonadota bacterium]